MLNAKIERKKLQQGDNTTCETNNVSTYFHPLFHNVIKGVTTDGILVCIMEGAGLSRENSLFRIYGTGCLHLDLPDVA